MLCAEAIFLLSRQRYSYRIKWLSFLLEILRRQKLVWSKTICVPSMIT